MIKRIIYSLLTSCLSLLSAQGSGFSLLVLCSMLHAPSSGLKAQTIPPPYINYQAILYDVNGPNPNAPYALQSFPAFVNLNDELGNLLYREEHYSSTDANGQVTIKIGDGLYLAGPITNFNQINWASGKYYLVVEFDINGTISATAPEQLVTVPYAFYAGNSGSGISTITDNGNGTLTFTYNNGTTYTTPVLSGLTGPQGPTGPAGQPGAPGPQGPAGPQGASGFLPNGNAAGNTPYWDGSQWVVNGTNVYNNGANLGVGTTAPASSAQLDVSATNKGFLAPRLTTAQRDAIANPDDGLIIFNISSGCPNYYFGGIWYEWCGTGVLPAGTIASLDCGTGTITGTLTQGVAAAGVSASISYTGGNGGTYSAQSFASTGVAGLVANLASGTLSNGSGSVTYTITGTPASTGTASFSLVLAGQTCTIDISVNLPQAALTAFNCSSATTSGSLLQGTAASGVSASVPYTGGNGGTYTAQTINSAGVTGLTATLSAGTLATGAGSVTYTITGTPATSGTASFALTLGEQTCTLSFSVASLTAQYPAGSVFCASGPTAIVEVTNPTTGKTWMDRNLGASQVATSSTDANAYGDLYQWGRRSDGHQCRTSATTTTLSTTDQPAHGNFIIVTSGNYDWRNPQNSNLWQGSTGVNNPCPSGYRVPTETELNDERLSWNNQNSIGAFNSNLKFPLTGYRDASTATFINVGNSGLYWTNLVSSSDSRSLSFNVGSALINSNGRANSFAIRCIKETVATLGALNCGSAATTGTLISGQATSGVSTTVPYTGGNGGYYAAQSVSSAGVTGLIATVSAGTLATGAGSVTYTITGSPASTGTASFELTLGGQSCTLTIPITSALAAQYPANSVFCASGPTAIVDVTNPSTGKTWMDRNLGASQVATSSTDANAYGDLYQWGRGSDGHQCRNSATTTILSSTDQPGHAFFITGNTDWRSPQNSNLWQGINGINNPCPTGYLIPSEAELVQESNSWISSDSNGAFASSLKLTLGGYRQNDGTLLNVNFAGKYWSRTIIGTDSRHLNLNSSSSTMETQIRAKARTIRCIKY